VLAIVLEEPALLAECAGRIPPERFANALLRRLYGLDPIYNLLLTFALVAVAYRGVGATPLTVRRAA